MTRPDVQGLPAGASGPWLVGGAVRDRLLELPVKDRDWLIVGATPQQMREMGYLPVGKGFEVFLHPETREEYALPRGGSLADPLETLKADLRCRDLTINAMAIGPDQQLIDPCGGRQDLAQRRLRHTPSFAEDPLRVLRLARFAARYAAQGFRIADQTTALCRQLCREGALDGLPGERIYQELLGGISANPVVFVEALRQLGALAAILPEVARLFGVPQPAQHHPEVDTGRHLLLALEVAAQISPQPAVRFGVLFHDLGKGLTPPDQWPRHLGHEEAGVEPIRALCHRLRIPNDIRDLAVLASRYHLHAHRAFELRPGTLLKMITALDGPRRPERFHGFLQICEADARGRLGLQHKPYPQAEFLAGLLEAVRAIDSQQIAAACSETSQVPEAIRRRRLQVIADYLRSQRR
jgi:tRNA nucleotidyltransferase (CCA-adding enzyme)